MRVKGSVLSARALWLKDQAPQIEARVRAALGKTDAAQLEKGFLPTAWYPIEVHQRLAEAIDQVVGTGDGSLYQVLGRDSCERNLTTIYRIFLRAGAMHFMVRRVAQGWRVHYDEGQMGVEESKGNRVRLTIADVPEPHASHCMPVFGWLGRAAELAGYENVRGRVERCRRRGAEVCEFRFEWD